MMSLFWVGLIRMIICKLFVLRLNLFVYHKKLIAHFLNLHLAQSDT